MPIRILTAPEPLTPATLDPDRARLPVLAESEAYRILLRDLERYVRGEVGGRSFLISGHRGAGKTTLVRQAIQTAMRTLDEADVPGRPLLVRLQGPALMPPLKDGREKDVEKPTGDGQGGQDASRKGDPGKEEEKGDGEVGDQESDENDQTDQGDDDEPGKVEEPVDGPTTIVLRQVTLALYRELTREVAQAYRARMKESRYPARSLDERLEIAAQLLLDLDSAPVPATMREYWRLAGGLSDGVLFRRGPDTARDQGLREIVAVAAAAQAYQLIAYTVSGSRTASSGVTMEEEAQLKASANLKELFRHGLGLLAGGAVGAGMLADDWPNLGAALAGIAAAVLTSGTLEFNTKRSSKRKIEEEYRFIRKIDESTLRREVPVLVERLQRAGLAPVFVVDELDKIDDLQERMKDVVNQLKLFISEGAFFCFLTDRDYFEHLRMKALREAYPREHTYFTTKLFVLYRPQELHAYLSQVLAVMGDEPADETDRQVLPYLILHRARMHVVDVRRELDRLRDAAGHVNLKVGEVRSGRGYRYAILIQLAVELLLASKLKTRLDLDPQFGQPIYDALYYPSRMWSTETRLDVSPAAFGRYLYERMNPNRSQAREGQGRELTAHEVEARLKGLLSELDIQLLHECVLLLVDLLSRPPSELRQTVEEQLGDAVPPAVLEALPEGAPLLDPSERTEIYDWRFDPFGRELGGTWAEALESEAVDVAVAGGDEQLDERLRRDIEAVADLDDFVLGQTGKLGLYELAEELQILSRAPSWSRVEEALERLRRHLGGDDLEPDREDLHYLEDYLVMLESRGALLGRCLIYAAGLGQARPKEDEPARLAAGLKVLSSELEFSSIRSLEEQERSVRELAETLDFEVSDDLAFLRGDFDRWSASVSERMEDLRDAVRFEAEIEIPAAWKRWRERLRHFLATGGSVAPDFGDLLLAAADRAPATVLRPQIERMSLGDWSAALLLALNGLDEEHPRRCPLWLAASSVAVLGLLAWAREDQPWLLGLERDWTRKDFDEILEWLSVCDNSRFGQRKPTPYALLLTQRRDSLTADWSPSERHGGVTVPYPLEEGLSLEPLMALLRPGKVPALLMIEPQEEPDKELRTLIEDWENNGGAALYLVRHRQDARTDRSAVVAPKDLDEALERGLKYLS